jgi:hypothetical protein
MPSAAAHRLLQQAVSVSRNDSHTNAVSAPRPVPPAASCRHLPPGGISRT